MSTRHSISNQNRPLFINEHSCLLDLYTTTKTLPDSSIEVLESKIMKDATAVDIRDLAIRLLQVASYAAKDPDEFLTEAMDMIKRDIGGQ